MHGSEATLPVLAAFLTEDLFELRNKDGMRALDVATAYKNVKLVKALEVLRRNLTV